MFKPTDILLCLWSCTMCTEFVRGMVHKKDACWSTILTETDSERLRNTFFEEVMQFVNSPERTKMHRSGENVLCPSLVEQNIWHLKWDFQHTNTLTGTLIFSDGSSACLFPVHISIYIKLQALVYDILPSTTAIFSYAIGPWKLLAKKQFFCWCSNSSKFDTNNSNYIRRLLYNWPCCLRQLK